MGSGRMRGIGMMLLAVAAFAVMDTVLKVLAARYPPMQVTALRAATSLPFVLGSVALLGAWRELRPVRHGLHLARGILGVVMIAGFVFTLRSLSLADAYSVFFIAPLLVTAFAVPLLGERVEWQSWVAIVIGLMGVLVMLRPSTDALATWAAVGAVISAVAYAFCAILARTLTRTDTTHSMVLSFLLVMAVLAGALALPDWVHVRREDWPWLLALGAIGTLAQHLITDAFRHAPASVLAPFEYTALLWGIMIDWTLWETLPGLRVWAGSAAVIGAGLYLIRRERFVQRPLAADMEQLHH